jgi:uncharacterized protein with gpF-like domain
MKRQNKRKKAPLSDLQRMAMYVAQVVRNEMEDFHAEYLSDAQMRELNPIVRNAIYTALYAAEQADQGCEGSRLWINFHKRWPVYWEPPELVEDYTRSVAQLGDGNLASQLAQLLGGRR